METNITKQEVLLFTGTRFYKTQEKQHEDKKKITWVPKDAAQVTRKQFLLEMLPKILESEFTALNQPIQIRPALYFVGIDMGAAFDLEDGHAGIDPHVFLITKEMN